MSMGDSDVEPHGSLSMKVVEGVAKQTEVDEMELPHLANVINPDALDELFESVSTENQQSSICVNFNYADHRITVRPDRTVLVDSIE